MSAADVLAEVVARLPESSLPVIDDIDLNTTTVRMRGTVESFCARHGIGYVPIDTSTALESLIFDILRRRGVVR